MAAESDNRMNGLGYVVASGYREAIVTELDDGAATPSELAEETDLELSNVSRALTQLRGRDSPVVELLVNEDRKQGRLYGLTEYGQDLVTKLEEVR